MNLNLEPLIARAAAANGEEPGDYQVKGVLHCGKCRTPKQTAITVMGRDRLVGCMCRCAQEEYERKRKAQRDTERRLYINGLRVNGIQDKSIRDMRFEADDGNTPEEMDKARRYVTAWPKMYRENVGLLFWGNTGNGKTFAAACIANALIDQGEPVMVTSFPRILKALNALYKDDQNAYIDSLDQFNLLVIDDLGAERQSSYALEQVYNVIDRRYKAKKPLIVTTNLPLSSLQKAESMDYRRVYDRVLELCIPIAYKGGSRRKKIAAQKMEAMQGLFGGDGA